MAERHLQKACVDWFKQNYRDDLIVNIHGSGWSNKGYPDLLICLNGKYVTCELKVGNNKLSEAQKLWKRRILKAGGYWCSPYTLEEFQDFIREVACQ